MKQALFFPSLHPLAVSAFILASGGRRMLHNFTEGAA